VHVLYILVYTADVRIFLLFFEKVVFAQTLPKGATGGWGEGG